jgi:CHAT domain-containing protein/tetratricopeptide (TPR) repeat protein
LKVASSIRVWVPLVLASYLAFACARGAGAQCYRFSDSKSSTSVTVSITNLPAPTIAPGDQESVSYKYDLMGLSGNSVTLTVGTNTATVIDVLAFSVTLSTGPFSGTTLMFVVVGNGWPRATIALHASSNPDLPTGLLPNGLPRRLPPRSVWSGASMGVILNNSSGEAVGFSGGIDAIESCGGPPPPAVAAPSPVVQAPSLPVPVVPTAEEMELVPAPPQPAPEKRAVGENPLGRTPFHFRDVFLLEDRLQQIHDSDTKYSPSHDENILSNFFQSPLAHSPAMPPFPDPTNLAYYQDAGWLILMHEADRFGSMGGFEVAEKRLRLILGMLRKVQGPETDAVAMMLDHIGELYLDKRDFRGAYDILTEALKVRRSTLAALPKPQAGTSPVAATDPRTVYRLHLAELLTRLGQLDLAREEWDLAAKELGEAVAISNEPANLPYLNGLYALYFQSALLERRGLWQQAEALWRDAVALRAPLATSEAYWNALREMAAFYARHGDFHAAAATARTVQEGTAGKKLTPELPIPYLSNWPRAQQSLYRRESNIAMSEILAVDTWRSDGPEAAAKLLEDPLRGPSGGQILDYAAGSERAQLLAWLERRTFLHLSVLLDGDPSQERVEAAYDLLCKVKGRFLASESYMHRVFEAERGDPSAAHPQHLAELDQLADVRQRLAHLFITDAIDGKPVNGSDFVALEALEQTVSRALGTDYAQTPSSYFDRPQGRGLEADTVLIDFFKWQRTDRQSAGLLPEEYGAFVTRRGEPVRYIALGPAAPIDRDIRSFPLAGQPLEVWREVLQRLYRRLIAPIESRIGGAVGAPGEIRKLLIVPDGMLTLAPFGALIDDSGHYLLERSTVGYLNTTRDLRGTDTRRAPSPAVIVANPDFDLMLGAASTATKRRIDPFTFQRNFELEAQAVAKRLGVAPDRIVTGKMARENLVKSLTGPEVLHLATHSIPNFEWQAPVSAWNLFEFPEPLTAPNPALQSLIALAGANSEQTVDEDGLLTGLEVEGLHLNGTKLVVLASCEAGQGLPVDGEGVLGLRTAFAMAGAEGVITNLWKGSDDASRELMTFFYSHLEDRGGPAEALRLAQLEMMRKTPYTDPFYWAGYQYAGTAAPRRLTTTDSVQPAEAHGSETSVRMKVIRLRSCEAEGCHEAVPLKAISRILSPSVTTRTPLRSATVNRP